MNMEMPRHETEDVGEKRNSVFHYEYDNEVLDRHDSMTNTIFVAFS